MTTTSQPEKQNQFQQQLNQPHEEVKPIQTIQYQLPIAKAHYVLLEHLEFRSNYQDSRMHSAKLPTFLFVSAVCLFEAVRFNSVLIVVR